MTPTIRENVAAPAAPGFLTRFGCIIQAWVIGWAVTVYLSATFRTLVEQPEVQASALPYAIFQTADNVPPMAKISLGVLIALGLAASALLRRNKSVPRVHRVGIETAAIALVAMLGALELPVNYYPGTGATTGLQLMLHGLAGAFGGLTIYLSNTACARRKERRNR